MEGESRWQKLCRIEVIHFLTYLSLNYPGCHEVYFFFLFSFFFLFFFFLFLLISTFRVEPTNGFVMEKPFIIQLFSQSINQSVSQSVKSVNQSVVAR